MIELKRKNLVLTVDKTKLRTMTLLTDDVAQSRLSKLWDTEKSDLSHYIAVFYDKDMGKISEKDSFVTVSFSDVGYMIDAKEKVDLVEAKKQIEIDLEIINRESQWGKEESIYFDQWWPEPAYDASKSTLEFGVSLKDFHQQVFNRTINRINLTRFGFISFNYSMSEKDILENKPLSHFQKKLDEIYGSVSVASGFRFQDVDENNDFPSKSRMINLLLSSEIF